MNSGETPKPNNKVSVTSSNTTNPPQNHPHHQHLTVSTSTAEPTNNHDASSPPPLRPPEAAAAEEGGANGGRSKFERDIFDDFPSGYRFCPTDEELVVEYLMPQVAGNPKHKSRIHAVNIFDYNPRQLTGEYREFKENEWYFFTPRKKKYIKGRRPDRAAGDGYWKATGADSKVISNGVQVGTRMSLVFHEGRPPIGVKTNWLMHEYILTTPPPSKASKQNQSNDTVLDKCVLCRIYKKYSKNGRSTPEDDDEEEVEEDKSTLPNEVDDEDNNGGCGGGGDVDIIEDGLMDDPVLEGMINSKYIISPIPQSQVYTNPNPYMASSDHQLHDRPMPFHSVNPNSFNPSPLDSNTHSVNPDSFNPSPLDSNTHFSPNSVNPNSFNPNPLDSNTHFSPNSVNPNSFNPSPLDSNTHFSPNSLNPDSNHYSNMPSSSHQLREPPWHLYPNSYVDPDFFNPNNSFNPNSSVNPGSFNANHSFNTGLMTNDTSLRSSMNNLDSIGSASLYPLDLHANLDYVSDQMMGWHGLRTDDYISHPAPIDFSSRNDHNQITIPHANDPYSLDHHVQSAAGESQFSTNREF